MVLQTRNLFVPDTPCRFMLVLLVRLSLVSPGQRRSYLVVTGDHWSSLVPPGGLSPAEDQDHWHAS